MATERGHFIGTYGGIKFYPKDPKVEDVDIVDIAHSLAHQCRYGGHSKQFYSVAEHCCHMAEWVWRQTQNWNHTFAALMHDASEAYVSDVPRPLKVQLPEFYAMEENVAETIFSRYNIPWPIPEIVHEADNRILFDEAPVLMTLPMSEWPPELHGHHSMEPLGIELACWEPSVAKEEFLEWFDSLAPCFT